MPFARFQRVKVGVPMDAHFNYSSISTKLAYAISVHKSRSQTWTNDLTQCYVSWHEKRTKTLLCLVVTVGDEP